MRTASLAVLFVSIGVFVLGGSDQTAAKDQTLYQLNANIGNAGTGAAGTGSILYHGGPIMGVNYTTPCSSGTGSPIKIYYIWYGNWASLDWGANFILTTLANSIGGSPYFNINSTYYMTVTPPPPPPTCSAANFYLTNAVSFGGSVNDNYTQGTAVTDFGATGSVEAVVKSHVGAGSTYHDLPLDPNGVYFVLTTPDVNETTGFCSAYCGWHSYTTVSGTNIAFAFVGDPLKCPGSCEWQSIGPNGSGGGDGMASIVSHELEESATDPLLNAWYFSSGNENADQCAWTFGTTKTASNGAVYNMTLGGLNYLIQQNWLNVGAGMCALSYSSTPDFSLSATPGAQSVGPTGSTSYTINVGVLSGFSGNVTLTVTSTLPAGVSANITGSPVAAPGAATLNVTTSGAAGGSYSITVQGVSGSLTHSTTVTLNVTDFTISVSPGSRTVSQGGSATYTLTDTALGGFSSSVNFTTGGLPPGATAGFTPASVAGSGSSTMTVTTTSTTPVGTYTLSVTGSTSGGLSHSTTTSLTVNAPSIGFTPIRINTGGAAYTDSLGNVWSADSGYSGGFTNSTSKTISGTPDQQLYQNWRGASSGTPLVYTFNGIPNGSYSATLDFTDPVASTVGQRVFNVAINGTTVLSNFDIFKTAGQAVALPQSFPVTVSSGTIAITFTSVSGSLPAIVNAISIVSGGTSAPTLTSISPSSGVAGGASFGVTLNGTNLSGASINPIPGITITGVSSTASTVSATFAIASGATTGPQNVTVTNSGATSNAVTFTINPPAPALTSISPSSGVAGGASFGVTLNGSNLSGASINPIPGITITGVSSTATTVSATFAIASGAATGPQSVTVTNSGSTSNAVTFTINPPAPSLTSISPSSGVAGSAAFGITLNGSNLSGATINPIPGITITGVSSTATTVSATFAIASGATTGPQNVTVTNSGSTSNAVTFTINPPAPSLTSISPSSGVAGGAPFGVTLNGSNLSGASINPIPGITITGVSSTASTVSATFAIASGATPGPQSVTVTNSAGTSNAVTFTINAAAGFTPIRVDAGSTTAYTDSSGNVWSADTNYSGGFLSSSTANISGTPDPKLYQSWRAAPDSGVMTYTFTGIPNSTRTVILDFAESAVAAAGQRVFNVAINGTTVLSNFDIFQTAGANHALSLSFSTTVSTGQIVIQFTKAAGVRPPIIDAIAIQ
ncbi:MAG: hypothetical protein JO062_07585 [Bryobacterales bacterium]|nr:hypothetical protein [Bryobacterales bacterium]